MLPEVLLLALASTVRPTSLAAVAALVTRESRRRLMSAYVVGGLAFTMIFGIVVVGGFHGVHIHAGTGRTKAVGDSVAGAAAVLFGLAILAGVTGPRRTRSAYGGTWIARLDRKVTVRVAAFAGPLTHVPGIFYLIALNVIVAHDPRLPGGLGAVAAYNCVWFALPIAVLVLCVADPEVARAIVVRVQTFSRRNSRTIVLVTAFAVGSALLIRGLPHL